MPTFLPLDIYPISTIKTAAKGTLIIGISAVGVVEITPAEASPLETIPPNAISELDAAAAASTTSAASTTIIPESSPLDITWSTDAIAETAGEPASAAIAADSTDSIASPSAAAPSEIEFSPTPDGGNDISTSAQDLVFETPSTAPETTPEGTPQTAPDDTYLIQPRRAEDDQVNPLTTTVLLNDVPIDHLTDWDAIASERFSRTIDSNPSGSGTVALSSRVLESLTRDNVYTVDQRGSYLQLRTLPHERIVTTTRRVPQTMLGMELQMSLTGACILPDSASQSSADQCTYTPGLVTSRNSIDPDFFVPTRVRQPSSVGDVVTLESLAAIRQPGFQRGANGQEIGVDLYFPNLGTFPGNDSDTETDIDRKEDINDTVSGTFSRVRQVVRANDTEAVLGRTIRGMSMLADDGNRIANTAVQAIAQALPEYMPQIEGSDSPANTNINRNLFLAANNTRLPSSSLTVYSVGRGRARSLTPEVTDLNQVPAARYNSLWLGLSPVIDRSIGTGNLRFEPRGDQRTIASGGGEGGGDANVDLLSVVNDDIFTNANLQDSYAQIYLDIFAQDIDNVTEQV
ncbi:MAG: hypothetical protein WBA10_14160 [Elainellaceae cyanobacterium]